MTHTRKRKSEEMVEEDSSKLVEPTIFFIDLLQKDVIQNSPPEKIVDLLEHELAKWSKILQKESTIDDVISLSSYFLSWFYYDKLVWEKNDPIIEKNLKDPRISNSIISFLKQWSPRIRKIDSSFFLFDTGKNSELLGQILGLTKIEWLSGYFNKNKSPRPCEILLEYVRRTNTLRGLKITETHLFGDSNIGNSINLFKSLEHHSLLTNLSLNVQRPFPLYCYENASIINILKNTLKELERLSTLNLTLSLSFNIKHEDMRDFFKVLQTQSSLTSISINITSDLFDMKRMKRIEPPICLFKNSRLKALSLSGYTLIQEEGTETSLALKENTRLKELNLDYEFPAVESLFAFLKIAFHHPSLRVFICSARAKKWMNHNIDLLMEEVATTPLKGFMIKEAYLSSRGNDIYIKGLSCNQNILFYTPTYSRGGDKIEFDVEFKEHERNRPNLENWQMICFIISFVRANKTNSLCNSFLPLLLPRLKKLAEERLFTYLDIETTFSIKH